VPDAEHRVIYRAVADFTNLAAEAAKARAEIEKLKDVEGRSTTTSTQQITDLAKAHERKNAALREERVEEERARQSTAQTAAATLADVKATESRADALRRAAAAQRQAQDSAGRHQQALEKDGKAAQSSAADLDKLARSYQEQAQAAHRADQEAQQRAARPTPRSPAQLPSQRRPDDAEITQVVARTAQAFASREPPTGPIPLGAGPPGEHPDITRARTQGTDAIAKAERDLATARTRVASASVSAATADATLESARRRSAVTDAKVQRTSEELQKLRLLGASDRVVGQAEERYATALERDAIAIGRLREAELRVQRSRLTGQRVVQQQTEAEAHLAKVRSDAQRALAAVASRVATEAGGGVHLPVDFRLRDPERLLADIDRLAQAAGLRFGAEITQAVQALKLPSDTPFIAGVERTAKSAASRLADLLTLPSHAEQRGAVKATATAQEEGAQQITAAENALTEARRRAETALLRVRAAVLNYDRAEKTFGETSRQARTAEIQLEAARLGGVKAVNDVAKATAALGTVHKDVDKAIAEAAKTARNTGTAWQILQRAAKDLGQTVGDTAKNVERGIRTALADLGAGASGAARFGAAVGGAAKGLTSAGSGFAGFTGILKSGFGVLEAVGGAFQFLDRMILPIAGWASLIGPAIGLLTSLGGAALGLVGAFGSLGGSIAALPGLLVAGAIGAGALLISISPLIEAIKAYGAVSDATRAAAFDPLTVQQQIQKQHTLQEAIWGVTSALDGEDAAAFGLKRANESLTSAQNSLREAWLSAQRQLQDLQEAVTNGALTERGATLSLAQAQLAYRQALADPTKTLLDREQALQAVQEAQVKLNDTQTTNVRNQQDLAIAQAKGVAGSDQVVSAQQAMESAVQGLSQAQEQQVTSQQAVIKAMWALSAAQVAAAQPTSAIASAQAKLKVILDELSPSALKVYNAFAGLPGIWRSLSKQIQESFFGQFAGQATQLVGLLPQVTDLFTKAGTALGGVVSRGIAMVSSGPWKQDFATGAQANAVVLTNLGNAGLSVVDALHNIAIAAIPFTTWVSAGIAKAAAEFDKWSASTRKSGNLADFLQRLEPRLHTTGDIIKNIFETIGRFGSAARPFNDWLLNGLDKVTKGWAAFAEKSKQPGSGFQTALQNMEPLLSALGGLIHTLADGLISLGSDPTNLKNLTALVTTLNNDLLPKLFSWLQQVNRSSALHDIGKALSVVFQAIDTFLKSGGGGAITSFFTTLAVLLNIISTLHLAPALGVLAVGFGILSGLKFLGLFKLARMLAKIPLFSKLVAGLGTALGKIPGLSKLTDALGLTGKNASAATAGEELIAGAKTAGESFLGDVRAAGLAFREAVAGGGATAEGELAAGGATAEGEMAAGGATAAGEEGLGGAAAGLGGAAGVLNKAGIALGLAAAGFAAFELGQHVVGPALDKLGVLPHQYSPTTSVGQSTYDYWRDLLKGTMVVPRATRDDPAFQQFLAVGSPAYRVGRNGTVEKVPGPAGPGAPAFPKVSTSPVIPATPSATAGTALGSALGGVLGTGLLGSVGNALKRVPGIVAGSLLGPLSGALAAGSKLVAPAVGGVVRAARSFFDSAASTLTAGRRTASGAAASVVTATGSFFSRLGLTPAQTRAVQGAVSGVVSGVQRLFQAATVPPAVSAGARAAAQGVISSVHGLLQQGTVPLGGATDARIAAQGLIGSIQRLFAQGTIPPDAQRGVASGAQAAVTGLGRMFSSTTIPQNVISSVQAAAQAAVDNLNRLFSSATVRGAVVSGVTAAIPGRAGGGPLPEGLSAVGETGMELAYKRGPVVDIIPMTPLPGFALGTDFGAALLTHPAFAIAGAPSRAEHHTAPQSADSGGITIGTVEINNPAPEKSGDSLYRALQKINYFAGRG
jgi:hypothetical protein